MNKQLLQQVNSLTSTVDSLNATINAQTQLIAQLNQTIQELKEQLNKNSTNSSKPPSSDVFKKPAPKSLRKPSGKKAGGQNGHQGTHLAVITAPDKIVKHMPSACEGCPHYQICKRQCEYKEINTAELQKQSRQLTSEKMELYDDYKDGRMDRDLYKQRAEKISGQLDEIKRKIEDAENSKKLLEQNELSDKIKLKDFLGIQKFDTEKLREIIKVIRVHSP